MILHIKCSKITLIDVFWGVFMTTYKQIQNYIKETYNLCVKTCWIADIKEQCGLKMRHAPNRISKDKRTNPCPESKSECIKATLRHFKMI